MLDKILKYMEDNYSYEWDEENGVRGAKIVFYTDLKEFIEKLKKECENMEKVKVIFRKTKNPDTKKYEVIAFMPELPANYGKIMSYMHIGQHGEVDLGFYHETKKAIEMEYKPLLEELKMIYESNNCELVIKQKLYYKDLHRVK